MRCERSEEPIPLGGGMTGRALKGMMCGARCTYESEREWCVVWSCRMRQAAAARCGREGQG